VRVGGARFDGSDDTPVARFTRIRLARSGIAAYIADFGPQGDRVVQDTDGGIYARGARLDPAFLRLAGSTVAWRVGSTYEFSALEERQSPPGTLLVLDRVRVEAIVSAHRTELRARYGRRPTVPLGEPKSVCGSSSGCSGIDALQSVGHFLAARYFATSLNDVSGRLTIHDLRTGQDRILCRRVYSGYVRAFVLTGRGTAACTVSLNGVGAPQVHEIRAEGRLLDRGPGIDPDSLHRRGDRLVWLNDSVERTAPSP
jgi:hypothetical protein